MKKIMMIAALAIGTIAFAQENKNEVKETVTTKTNVKDNTGTKVYKQDVTKTQTEKVELKATDANQTNQMATMKPMDVQINETYSNSGTNFMFEKENNGYRLKNMTNTSANGQNGILRASSRKGYYILYMDNKSSLGYFDANGSFIVENYDPKTDTIVATKYALLETGGIKPMRDTKMNSESNEQMMKENKMKENKKMKNKKKSKKQ